MHASKPTSRRLQRLLRTLRKHGLRGATSRQLAQETGSMAVATDVSELRRSGYLVPCEYEGKTPEGRKVYRYSLFAEPFE